MATTANPPPGATAANGGMDPFVTTPHAHSAATRFAPFDTDQFSLYTTSSPTQARRALEAHLKDTDRRIQDASRLGTTLIQQRKDLTARLKDVEHVQQDSEVPDDLRKKLSELEKEYNEVGKESARAFLPKSRVPSTGGDPASTPSAFTGSGRESPTKMTAPSRRQRNQPTNRVHDIEFATEISTSLLAQVRQLQAALAEKDDTLRDTTASKAQLDAEAAGMVQRIKQMDESEQRYKDENWNLETKLQDLEASFKDSTDKEQRLTQNLKTTQSERASAQRDLDDLKVSHEKLNEEHAGVKRQQETDLNGLRRDAATHESEKSKFQKKIEELTAQNTELAKAVSYRWNQPSAAADTERVSAEEDPHTDDGTPENSDAASPVKGTPRHGMLESETLKSSLNHAHRMIQNLKNNIHREKTEKIELKRLLQDSRDELEARRNEGGAAAASLAKKRRSEQDNAKFKKPARPDRLGANRSSTTEIMEDEPDWEDHDGTNTPSKSRNVSAAFGGVAAGAAGTAALDYAFGGDETESTDAAFETATERDGTTTDAFETSREDVAGDHSDELTETEGGVNRSSTIRQAVSPLVGAKPRHRRSFESTASTDGEDEVLTPIQAQQQPKYRMRMNNRASSKRDRVSDLAGESPSQQYSPASSNGTPQPAGQSLGDELDALDDDNNSLEGTPSRTIDSATATPETQRKTSTEPGEEEDEPEIGSPTVAAQSPKPHGEAAMLAHQANAGMLAHEFAVRKPEYANAGVMTEPWEPEAASDGRKRGFRERAAEVVAGEPEAAGGETGDGRKHGLRERAGEVVGGALAGFGFGGLGRKKEEEDVDEQADAGAEETTLVDTRPSTARDMDAQLQQSEILWQETIPVSPPRPDVGRTESGFQRITDAVAEPAVPLAAAAPLAVTADEKRPEPFNFSSVVGQDMEPIAPVTPHTPLLPKRSSRRMDTLLADDEETPSEDRGGIPGTDSARVGAGFFGATAALPLVRTPSQTASDQNVAGSSDSVDKHGLASPHELLRGFSSESVIPITKPLQIKKPMADEGSQTIVSGDDIESMMRNKSAATTAGVGVGAAIAGAAAGVALSKASNSPARPSTAVRDSFSKPIDGVVSNDGADPRTPRRPASASSIRNNRVGMQPPLPEDHTLKIQAAQKTPGTPGTATVGTMGPPTMPASAYKIKRPSTPAEGGRTLSRDGTTPRAQRGSGSVMQSPTQSQVSRKTSVGSFASEIDERFQLHHGQLMYPEGVPPTTDPRMIQAITQTMIGEYLWKYTRKAGRSGTSTTRHRRFFWVHPYTRTLYWSEKDPSTAGRDMLKAKSVAIEAVRVITDDNTYPPGLHRKSLVVVTPGREILFTAPTGQRHETWFNALSYLLLRTEQEKEEAEDTINQDDIDEFNPGIGNSIRRSISRLTGRRSSSHLSMSSYNSRSSSKGSRERKQAGSSLAQRQSAAAERAKGPPPVGENASRYGSHTSRQSTVRDSNAGRLSSFTSKFRPANGQRGSFSSQRGRPSAMSSRDQPGDPSEIYDASVAAESAEDLRAVIQKQEEDADRLENVRACCDGKHDVGSLSRAGRQGAVRNSSFGSRFSHNHNHAHAHPRAEPMSQSSKPRRGE